MRTRTSSAPRAHGIRWARPAGRALVVGLLASASGCLTDSEILKRSGGPAAPSARNGGARRPLAAPSTTAAERARALCFVCKSWEDTNGNGTMDYPGEFLGVGNRFTVEDKIALGLKVGITRAYTRTFRLWDQTNTLVYEKEKELEASRTGRVSLFQFKPGDLAAGPYQASWSIDGDEVCSTKFEVVE